MIQNPRFKLAELLWCESVFLCPLYMVELRAGTGLGVFGAIVLTFGHSQKAGEVGKLASMQYDLHGQQPKLLCEAV